MPPGGHLLSFSPTHFLFSNHPHILQVSNAFLLKPNSPSCSPSLFISYFFLFFWRAHFMLSSPPPHQTCKNFSYFDTEYFLLWYMSLHRINFNSGIKFCTKSFAYIIVSFIKEAPTQ